jgi:hypothetical protein
MGYGEVTMVVGLDREMKEHYLGAGDAHGAAYKKVFKEIVWVGQEADGGAIGYWLHQPGLSVGKAPIVYLSNEGGLSTEAATIEDYFAAKDLRIRQWFSDRKVKQFKSKEQVAKESKELPQIAHYFDKLLAQKGTPKPLGEGETPKLEGHFACALPDGRVVIGAGSEIGSPNVDVWIADRDGALHRGAPLPNELLSAAACTLRDGRVLVAGGFGAIAIKGQRVPAIGACAECYVYDPESGAWTAAGKLKIARQGAAIVALDDGGALIAGGVGKDRENIAELERWDPKKKSAAPAGRLKAPLRFVAMARLLDGRVLLSGGEDAKYQVQRSAQLFDPKTSSLSKTGDMTEERRSHTLTVLPDGRVLAASRDSWETFDASSGTWTKGGPLRSRYAHSATLLADGCVLLVGGQPEDKTLVERLDTKTKKITSAGKLKTPRNGHTASLLQDGRVLLVGGHTGKTNHTAPPEILPHV